MIDITTFVVHRYMLLACMRFLNIPFVQVVMGVIVTKVLLHKALFMPPRGVQCACASFIHAYLSCFNHVVDLDVSLQMGRMS